MKRNGMCPICYIKKLFTKKSAITNIYDETPYENGVITPPMGWSSWNTFKNKIDQNLILEAANALKDKGLVDVGYSYINLDDNWHSSLRDENGELQGDLTTFSRGIPDLVNKINALGIKVGIYSSNGTETCEDLPASLYNERRDAYTFAKWGIEYFKYDFCHNIPISKYAPLVFGITIAPVGKDEGKTYLASEFKLDGLARFMTDHKLPGNSYVSGLDEAGGSMKIDNVEVEEDGKYVLTVNVKKAGQFKKFLLIKINDKDIHYLDVPSQKFWNHTARFQVVVQLKRGNNTIWMLNPIAKRADSAMLQYQYMGKMLKEATKKVSAETQTPEKPIVFSLCEWGRNQPYKWGHTAGNLWRTTGDINTNWQWMMLIYNINVELYKYASIGHYNDPDMLEVGNGKLTYDENVSHFSLWCMMNAPLILGNDIRKMPKNILDIVCNRKLIAINQDALGKQAKRIIKSTLDVLVKPLSDESVAICIFNKANKEEDYNLPIEKIIREPYAQLPRKNKYIVEDLWLGTTVEIKDILEMKIPPHGAKVFLIKYEK